MQCDNILSKIELIKNELLETERGRVRVIEDMYDWMISVVPSAKNSINLPMHLKSWVENRKQLRAELKRLSND